jgi:hypothetical protein
MEEATPASVDDPVLGRLDWDGKLDWWVGSVDYAPGHRVEVFVNHDFGSGRPGDEIAAAGRNLARVREREAGYRRWSADRLHGRRWNTDEPMTPAEIADLLRVASLEFGSDGGVRIFWDDQDRLFGGHNVVTDIGPGGECVGSGME